MDQTDTLAALDFTTCFDRLSPDEYAEVLAGLSADVERIVAAREPDPNA